MIDQDGYEPPESKVSVASSPIDPHSPVWELWADGVDDDESDELEVVVTHRAYTTTYTTTTTYQLGPHTRSHTEHHTIITNRPRPNNA